MKRSKCTLLVVMAVLCIGLFSVNVYAADAKPDATRSDAAPEDWEFVLQLYGWIAEIDGTTADGHDFTIDFKTIVENLDMTLMTTVGARKDKWTFMTDVLYLDINDSSNSNLNPALKRSDLYMKAWVVSPFVSYEIIGNKKGSLQVLAGARYLWIEVGVELKTRPPLEPEKIDDDGDGDVWDGVVGVRGFYNLTDRWFIPYRLDFGAGDTDFTWHAFGGIGYKFDKFKMVAAYRHVDWNFANDSVLDDLQVSGPLVGALFTF